MKYDLTDWLFTTRVDVDENAIPHSHPVLTINTEHEGNEALFLAAFVHEQLHWFEEEHAEIRDRAIDDTVQYFPKVPSDRPEGAGDEESTRLHLLVCYLEYQALKRILGIQTAKQTIIALSEHHYSWVYRTVLKDGPKIRRIIQKHNLLPASLRK
jgi:hypothetical protein